MSATRASDLNLNLKAGDYKDERPKMHCDWRDIRTIADAAWGGIIEDAVLVEVRLEACLFGGRVRELLQT